MNHKHNPAEPISLAEAMTYEVYSVRWLGYISWPWLQALASRYCRRCTKRRHAHYLDCCRRQLALDLLRAHGLAPHPAAR